MQRIVSIMTFICLALLLAVSSCKKESFITDSGARLNITADSIKFDTVFTTTGSVTRSFKLINENDQALRIGSIKLMGGSGSAFKMNINGIPATEINNTEIAANDSIYIFVAVTINPTTNQLPFIVSDSIQIEYNNNSRKVILEAYGQNAHFLNNQTIHSSTIWTNDLPYVILGGLRIDSNISLTIESGCRIYAHAGATILVDGSLLCNGTKNNEVHFSGDRLDEGYRDLPGSWPGIYFRSTSTNNRLTFTVISNAFRAIQAEDVAVQTIPKLVLEQCIIRQASDYGLLAQNCNVSVSNSLISNCGNNAAIQLGGKYRFDHCTLTSYSNTYFIHEFPVLQVSNALFQNGQLLSTDLDAVFRNCIFWGDGGTVDDEVQVTREGSTAFSAIFENCLYKAVNDPTNTSLLAVIKNQDPLFDSIDISNRYYDFHFNNNPFSPAIDQGTNSSFPRDLDDLPRVVGTAPDLGCYERQ